MMPRDREKCLRRVGELARPAVDQPQLPGQAHLRDLHRGELAATELRQRAAPREQCHTHLHLDRALDGFEAGQRHLDVDRRVLLLERAQHAFTRGRRIVVRDDRLAPELGERHFLAAGQRVLWMHEHHQIVGPQVQRQQSALGRLKRHDAEVETPL